MFLYLGYVVFLVFLFEGLARLAFFIPQVSDRLQGDDSYTWQRKWVHRHQMSGVKISYKFDIYDATKGWILKPNLRDMRVFDHKILNTNSKGFRGRKDIPYHKNTNKLRILILGDSYTFGDEVSDNETYAFYLQEMLPHTEVINLGVHGYGHDQMLILLKEEGVKYKPDIVILGFVRSDMSRNLLTFRSVAKPRFILKNGELKLIGSPVPRPEDILRRDWIRPRIFDMVSIIRHRIRVLTRLHKKEMQDVTTAILMDMIKTIENMNAIPIIVYLPTGSELSKLTTAKKDEAYMFTLCQAKKQAKCFSTSPYLAEKISKGANFKLKMHWTPSAHRTVAEAIERSLIDEGLIALP